MKKSIGILTALLLAGVMTVTSCAKKSGTDNSLEETKKNGTLVMGLDDSFPPMGFRDKNNEIVGYDVDLAKEVAKRLGVTLKLQPIDWATKEQELNTKKIDCIWNGFTMTKERQEAMAFTKAYLDNAQVVIVKNDSTIQNTNDLNGKLIGVQAGSSAWDAVSADTNLLNSLAGVVEFEENLTALNDLGIGNIDAVVMDLVVAEYTIKQAGYPYRILAQGLANEEYGVAFRKNDVKLRDEVQRILEEMEKDGTVASICNEWFGRNISVIGS